MTPEQEGEFNRLMTLAKSYRNEAESHEGLADDAREDYEDCLDEAKDFKEKCDDGDNVMRAINAVIAKWDSTPIEQDAVKKTPVTIPIDAWILTSERLPEKGQNVLISGPGIHMATSWMTSNARKTYFAGYQNHAVTHWQPLPAAPENKS